MCWMPEVGVSCQSNFFSFGSWYFLFKEEFEYLSVYLGEGRIHKYSVNKRELKDKAGFDMGNDAITMHMAGGKN